MFCSIKTILELCNIMMVKEFELIGYKLLLADCAQLQETRFDLCVI